MNSVLNPEAPEFYPHLKTITESGYSNIGKTLKSSNRLPSGTSYCVFNTFADFNIISSQFGDNIIKQSNDILTTEIQTAKLKFNNNQYNTEKIVEANDSLLDRVNISLDVVSGNKSSDNPLDGVQVSSWNKFPIITKVQVGSTMLLGAKNVLRPQLNFKDEIDNSEKLWIPKISDKPNSIKPLTLNILYNDKGDAVGYEHPYKIELDSYHPPAEFIEPDPKPPLFPPPPSDTQLTYIETKSQVEALIKHLESVTEFAVDVEHHSYRTYQGITCLIQISTNEGGDFIIDALAVREHLHKLNLAFTDPNKVKVFHGAEMDVLWLQRDFGVYIVGLFDTHQAAKVLQVVDGLSLKNLLRKYCDVDTDKKYQLADWRIRPLPEELIYYARMDTHYLLYIWRQMKAQLLEKCSGQPQLLLSVFEKSRHICGVTYNKEVIHDDSHMPLYMKSRKSFNAKQMEALKVLYKWRDSEARFLDESTTYLLPNHMLLSLAETLPREVQGVNACCNPMPPFVKQNLLLIHKMILSCRERPSETKMYQMPIQTRTFPVSDYQQKPSYDVHDVSQFPDNWERPVANLDRAITILRQVSQNYQSDIDSLETETCRWLVSDLNVDAKQFIPPYDRYRKCHTLLQSQENETLSKEVKITSIKGDDNIFTKQEVLIKFQQNETKTENENKQPAKIVSNLESDESSTQNKCIQRKRKISSTEKLEQMNSVKHITESNKKDYKLSKPEITSNVKPFLYKNVNYRKFYDETGKVHNQPKMKFKKH